MGGSNLKGSSNKVSPAGGCPGVPPSPPATWHVCFGHPPVQNDVVQLWPSAAFEHIVEAVVFAHVNVDTPLEPW